MRPGKLEKANLRLQIRNVEVEIHELFEKLDYLKLKLKTAVKPGKDKK